MKLSRLTALGAARAREGVHADGGGLYLRVRGSAKAWVFRSAAGGKAVEIGLGGVSKVTLAEARELAHAARLKVAAGVHPGKARERRKPDPGVPSFGECAEALISAKAPEWRSAKHAAQWTTTLKTYCTTLWSTPVNEVDVDAVLSVLRPVWASAPETARRVRARIENVLDAAKAAGHRQGENPALWKGNLAHRLPGRQRIARSHHPAMPHADVPAFVSRLRATDSPAARALEFTILTASRTAEVLGARWSEFGDTFTLWPIPASRMKSGRPHRVPVCGRALEILAERARAKNGDLVFAGPRGRPLSGDAMRTLMRRMGITDAVPHGFRSSFSTWASEETSFPREAVEEALAHLSGGATERSYRRGDALAKRRELMSAWGEYCGGESAAVVLRKAAPIQPDPLPEPAPQRPRAERIEAYGAALAEYIKRVGWPREADVQLLQRLYQVGDLSGAEFLVVDAMARPLLDAIVANQRSRQLLAIGPAGHFTPLPDQARSPEPWRATVKV